MFWVNPFGMSFRHIRVSDLILVDHQGNVVYGTKPVNRAAFVIHAAVHPARPDVVAAAHAHSPYGKAFSSLGIPLAPLTQDACIFYEDHHVISEQGGAVVFDIEAGRELASKFPDGKAAIHQNHGLFTVGETVDEAAFWFITMERTCQAQLLAMAAGDPIEIRHEDATYTQQNTGFPPRAGSASSRCGRRSAAPIPNCSSEPCPTRPPDRRPMSERSTGPVTRWLDTAQPEALFVLSADLAVHGRRHRRQPVRRGRSPRPSRGSASSARPSPLVAVSRAWRERWTRSELPRGGAVFGVVTALMNLCFYLGIDRRRPRQERGDRVHRPDRRRGGRHPHASATRWRSCSPSPA